MDSVWVFHGQGAPFASGVFSTEDDGMAWIEQNRLTGILTQYPVGEGCYDHAVRLGRFKPRKSHHGTPSHVASFSPSLLHVHVKDGHPDHGD